MHTSNEVANAPVIRLDDALGFRPVEREVLWSREI